MNKHAAALLAKANLYPPGPTRAIYLHAAIRAARQNPPLSLSPLAVGAHRTPADGESVGSSSFATQRAGARAGSLG